MRSHTLQTGTITLTERTCHGKGHGVLRLLNTLFDRTWTEPLPNYVWVIEHSEGIIVIDTGGAAEALGPGYYPWWHPYYKFYWEESTEPEEEIGPQLRALGIDPEEVRWVVLTHLHPVSGLKYFPKSEIIVSGKEYRFARGFLGQVRGYLPNRWPSWFKPRLIDFQPKTIGPFPESFTLTEAGDVRLVPTEGHTRGHLSVTIRDQGTTLFFAGDASYTQRFMIERIVDGLSPSEGQARRTLDRIRQYVQDTPTVYLPAHDPHSAERLAAREVVVI